MGYAVLFVDITSWMELCGVKLLQVTKTFFS